MRLPDKARQPFFLAMWWLPWKSPCKWFRHRKLERVVTGFSNGSLVPVPSPQSRGWGLGTTDVIWCALIEKNT